jgi:hypothetical protein
VTTKPLKIVLQAFLIDEDDTGQIVALVGLQPVEFVGLSIRDNLPGWLDQLEQLCRQRSAKLDANPAREGGDHGAHEA